jgi:hypothetical protein
MRIYDPADDILYVHLAPQPAGHRPSGTDHRLPAGYANQSPQTRLAGRADLSASAVGGSAPLLVVIAGGAEAVAGTSLAPPFLRLA